MTEPLTEILDLIAHVRGRWRLLKSLRAASVATAAATFVLALALLCARLFEPQGFAMIGLWAIAVAGASACLLAFIPSARRVPGDRQIARFVEERCPELDDVLATAVADQAAGSGAMAAAVVDAAVQRIKAIDRNRIIDNRAVLNAAAIAGSAAMAFAIAAMFCIGPVGGAMRLAVAHLFPANLVLNVAPGDVKVVAGAPLRVIARLSGGSGIVPVLRIDDGTELPMTVDGTEFALDFQQVDDDFQYMVTAAGSSSRMYAVTVVRPPRVTRIDLRYRYPAAFRMEDREEEDGGDIYGPAGTRVHVTVHVDKPVSRAELTLTGASTIPLTARAEAFQAELVITDDGSYRVALEDTDGLTSPGDTEYFIRTLMDRPPDVRIVRPASDRQVTPVEEVPIEAQADDDFGVSTLDLVYSIGVGPEKVVPFDREGEPTAVAGRRTLYLEDLSVKPGDVVAYYARARDVSRGKRSTEARSDIFFLEVTPFEQEFVASQSEGSGSGGDSGALEDLIQGQKDVITATWNLDRRSREALARPDGDIRAVGTAQRQLRSRTMATLAQMRRSADLRRRTTLGGRGAIGTADADTLVEAVTRAVEAMERAGQQLDSLRTGDALPHEMSALNDLLRAQAEVRRREVQQQQANGRGGRGSNRQQQDISSLFDRELARQQQTNYETPGRSETSEAGEREDDSLEKIRELARRQDELNDRQRELAQNRAAASVEELRRQLERLTREQSELRREAEELARKLQQAGSPSQQNQARQGGPSGQGQQGAAGSREAQGRGQGQGRQGAEGTGDQGQRQRAGQDLQQISEDMQHAASELRRENPTEASARGSRAVERLRDLEQRMRGTQPDDRRRALGELQLESRQLADAQRRLTAGTGGARDADQSDRARRQAVEQERLADRTERLEDALRQLAGASENANARERAALDGAVREIEQQRPSEQMRRAARTPAAGRGQGGGSAGGPQPSGERIARTLERVADQLGAAGSQSDDSERLTAELSRIRQLREELVALDRQLEELRKQVNGGNGQERATVPGARSQAGGIRNSDVQSPWQSARDLLAELQREQRLEGLPRETDGFNPGLSAPGTEAWKQDFSRWEELKVHLASALERAERTAADRLRAQQANDRLNAGSTQAVPDAYRRMVDEYYRALAK